MLTTLTGIAQMLLQYGTIFWFIKISDHLNGISGVFELDKDVADAEYIYRHILQLASVQSPLCPPLTIDFNIKIVFYGFVTIIDPL